MEDRTPCLRRRAASSARDRRSPPGEAVSGRAAASPIEPEPIDEHGLTQIDLEAARSLSLGLDRRDRKNRGRLPPDWRRIRVGDEQMRDFRARCIEQPEIRQAAGGHGPSVGISRHTETHAERASAGHESDIKRQTPRSRIRCDESAARIEMASAPVFARATVRRAGPRQPRRRPRHEVSCSLFWVRSTNFCNARATSASDAARPTSDPTRYKPPSDPRS